MSKDEQLKEFLEFYNNKVPNPIHHPKLFDYLIKLWKLEKSLNHKPD